ncbi:nitroreductase family protein [uncultured Nocardioides sp.]|uniref:nitroreductase family protein n=1 Tax=uncultured Nocardioides sp. TaxID=198441 RepID=UPI0026141EB0|nr:nitroreductase family protein [uncultured Nocardioides sp.]
MTDRAPEGEQALLAEPMRSRWSPSIFDDTHVITTEQVRLLLLAAQWAPSCGNAQPAAFVVAVRGSASHQVLVRHLSRGNSGWVPRASVVLVIGAQVAPDENGEGGYKPFHAEYDTGQAAAHLSLQARAMGLHAHQFAGFDKAAVAEELGVPAHYKLMAGIAVGVPGNPADVAERDRDREHRPRRRRPLAAVAHGARWGLPWDGLDE